jgi:electron-transferring-flavoprotein dehydrogenase
MELSMSVERMTMNVDVVCTGFGPAAAGFMHTLSKAIVDDNGQTVLESKAMPGMPLQVICYERADDLGFGVSGVVTKARGLRESLSEAELASIPMSTDVGKEEMLYLLDPHGASRRSTGVRMADAFQKLLSKDHAFKLPFIPPFIDKHGGKILTMGQFTQWVGAQVMGSGLAQIWPAMPVSEPLIKDNKVVGVRMLDQGVTKTGEPDAGYMPGMDILADLTVVADGPVGAVGMKLDEHFGLPQGNHRRDWAVGMKSVVELPESCTLKEGTVLHTMGYPEPEVFGFLYVLPDRMASLGIFIPSWFDNPAKNSYRYMQHWMTHPAIYKHIKGGTLKSWGAKSLQEDGIKGEPFLCGDGYARIGEGSGSTNILTNSGVDEAWKTGTLLAEAVIKLYKQNLPFTKQNLESEYVMPRKASWIGKDLEVARSARDGFQKGFIKGVIGSGLAGMTGGKLRFNEHVKLNHERIPSLEAYYKGKISAERIAQLRQEANAQGTNIYDALMDEAGWPAIEFDGKLLVSHQDALLMGGKVQAPHGYADHVVFLDSETCANCQKKLCIDICSGQAITPDETGMPVFDREKCVHCGACMWNCTEPRKDNPELSNIDFRAGTGGLHSAEN